MLYSHVNTLQHSHHSCHLGLQYSSCSSPLSVCVWEIPCSLKAVQGTTLSRIRRMNNGTTELKNIFKETEINRQSGKWVLALTADRLIKQSSSRQTSFHLCLAGSFSMSCGYNNWRVAQAFYSHLLGTLPGGYRIRWTKHRQKANLTQVVPLALLSLVFIPKIQDFHVTSAFWHIWKAWKLEFIFLFVLSPLLLKRKMIDKENG